MLDFEHSQIRCHSHQHVPRKTKLFAMILSESND
jgi:hypothetical protein